MGDDVKAACRGVFIIAEAGVNHNGQVSIAKRMITAAARVGADAIKFQTFAPDKLATRNAPLAAYQKNGREGGTSQFEMLKELQLGEADQRELFEHCAKEGIAFLSSCFDIESAIFLYSLGVETFKIPSGEINNLPLLRGIGALRRTILLSTGMATLEEIRVALRVLEKAGTPKKDITVLHCTTAYPVPLEDVNLSAMLTIRDQCGVQVGYSDHTQGIEIAIAAAALGAAVIEKHLTLDKNMKGPDHKASIDPDELASMVRSIRVVEKAMGDGVKRPSPSELENIAIVRRSIVASKEISAGERYSPENITVKRPGGGISPMEWDKVLGKRAKRGFRADELIEL
jgi:N,N'-diacetyllegionaminate synthase